MYCFQGIPCGVGLSVASVSMYREEEENGTGHHRISNHFMAPCSPLLRHVMARADLMALELMVHLGQRYRLKSLRVQESSTNGMLSAKPDSDAI